MPDTTRTDTIIISLGLPEFQVLEQWTNRTGIHVMVKKGEPVIGKCPRCGRLVLETAQTQTRSRIVQDFPLHDKAIFLHVMTRRGRCEEDGCWVRDSFESIAPYKRKTRRLRKALHDQSLGGRSVKEVANSYRVGYHAAYNAAFQFAGSGRKRALPELMGIDEFAKRKGQNYDTILLDLNNHRTIDILEDRSKDDIIKYLRSRSDQDRDRVRAVCMDLSDLFAGAIREALPEVVIVADRFHVMQLPVKVMDKVRCAIQRGLPKGEKEPIFKTRYILTKPAEKLDDEQLRLRNEIRAKYPSIDEVACRIEELRSWYQCRYKYLGSARKALEAIIEKAASSDIDDLRTLAKTLEKWKNEIVAYMQYRITNGPTEGRNNKVKTIKRQAYGHRNRVNLRSRILAQSPQPIREVANN